ncbi:invasion associated locus B family protein [Rhizobium sp. DKSPLA3]|uniref:Invasion associated locus B family protein n=1 Tax=Rhizobium quercicola TaxID=2901226 RepID=A0A9X1NUB7_9HYPH|nr:invasion associated locus B family protein [Rhizobium quercicola]MCD7109476.1 invasion associated locus B family protein [Rhizobium quercicola]
MRRLSLLSVTAALACAAVTGVSAQTAAKPSALSESYDDWTVRCATQGAPAETAGDPAKGGRSAGARECSLSQSQTNANGQRVLLVELRPAEDGRLRGNLVLPFGLALQKGATFAVDDLPPGKPAPFRTCLPVGCVVSLLFTDGITQSLRSGTTLTVKAQASDPETEVPFSISLKGFDAALQRTVALSKPE